MSSAPTARYDRTARTWVDLEGGAPPPSPAYSEGQPTVKGVLFQILVPHATMAKVEALGIPAATHLKVGGLQRLHRAIKDAEKPEDAPPPPVRSEESTLARQALGTEIKALRKHRGISRRVFASEVRRHADVMEGENWRYGWSDSSAQAWEAGTVTPRQIEPIIKALGPDPSQEVRWRHWWTISRVGLGREEKDQALADLRARAESSAVERLKATLAVAAEKLDETVATPDMPKLEPVYEDLVVDEDLDEMERRLAAQEEALAEKLEDIGYDAEAPIT